MSEVSERMLKEILNEAIDLRGLNIERLAQLTEIPERYLTALREGDFQKLPAAPYVRGYLLKVGEALDMDGRALWEIYKKQTPIKTSGTEDRLPVNRFAIKGVNKKLIFLGIVAVLVVVYLGWRSNELLGSPKLDVVNPPYNNYSVTGTEAKIKLTGEIDPKDKLMINDEEVLVSANGRFEKDFPLQAGVNTVKFKAKRFLGRETEIIRQVIYQP